MKKMTWRKWTARALALMLAGTMVLGGSALCGTTAYAAEDPSQIDTTKKGSIAIERKAGSGEDAESLTGAEFTAYKVLGLKSENGMISYEKVDAFADAIGTNTPETLGDLTSTQLDGLANALSKVDGKGTGTVTSGDTYKLENLDLGLYLVVETKTPAGYMASKPFLVSLPMTDNYNDSEAAATSWTYDVTAAVKNEKIGITKELAEEEGNDGTVAVGSFVKYEIQTTVPEYTDDYFVENAAVKFVISDTMSKGLEIQNDAAGTTNGHFVTVMVKKGEEAAQKVEPGENNANYELTAEPQANDDIPDLKIDFTKNFIQANRGAQVTVTYYAKVTADAVMGNAGNSNKAGLTYSNKPGTDSEGNPYTEETEEKPEVKVYTFGIQVAKFETEGGAKKALPGAKFQLYKGKVFESAELVETGEQDNTVTSDKDGKLTFANLDEGTYFLKETESPKGYTLLASPIMVEITAEKDTAGALTGAFTLKVDGKDVNVTEGDFVTQLSAADGIATVAVENHKGFSLPSTGGMGVTLFLIVGAAGIIGLSVAMTRKPKKQK